MFEIKLFMKHSLQIYYDADININWNVLEHMYYMYLSHGHFSYTK